MKVPHLSVLVFTVLCLCIIVVCCKDGGHNDAASDKTYYDLTQAASKMNSEGKKEASLHFFDSAYARYGNASPYGRFMRYAFRRLYYNKKSNMDSCLLYADSAIYILEQYNLEESHALDYTGSLVAKGDALYALNNYLQAYDSYFKAKLYARKISNECAVNEYSYSLGMALYRQGKYAAAAREFESGFNEALACTEHDRPLYRMQELLSNTALCFTKLNVPDSALYYYSKALAYIELHSKDFGPPIMSENAEGVVYGNIASVFVMQGRLDTAETLLKKSIALNVRPAGENRDAQKTKLKLASLYYQEDEPELMLQTLQDLRRSMDTLHNRAAENEWLQQMYLYYRKAGDPLKAIGYYDQYIAVTDTETERNRKQLHTDILQELNYKNLKYDNNLLKKNNQLNKVYLWITVLFSLLTLAIVILVYANYKRGRKNIQMLTALNEQINRQKAELEKSSLEKDRILNVVVHDLRGPVGAIAFLAGELMRGNAPEAEVQESIGLITEAARSSLELINELLGLSNETGSLKKEPTGINAFVKGCVRMIAYKATEKKQVIDLVLPATPVEANINSEKMARVLNNLLGNAIKFSKDGTAITVEVIDGGQTVLIKIKDSGIGIPLHMQAAVFEVFTPSKRYGTAGEQSFGLGLSISKRIVEAHNGKIWFESVEAEGTNFYIELPK